MKSLTEYNYSRFRASDYDLLQFDGPKLGEVVPDLEFTNLKGDKVSLSSFRGRQVVLEAGSMTCPMYVKDVTKMQDVAEQYPDTAFLVMYVREAHPGSSIPPHRSVDDKVADAGRLAKQFGEHRTVLIDDLEGTAHQLLGSFPNMVYIIDPEGVVSWRSSWSDAASVAAVLDGTADADHLAQDIVMPKRPTPWLSIRVLLRAGVNSLWHFVSSMPALLRSHGKVRKALTR